ncbi:MAG: ribosomal protein L13e [Candidatus Korarchaeota archaeon]
MKIDVSRPTGVNKKKLRGFSIGEIKEAKLTIAKARSFGIPVDKRRRTVYKENVKILQEVLKKR